MSVREGKSESEGDTFSDAETTESDGDSGCDNSNSEKENTSFNDPDGMGKSVGNNGCDNLKSEKGNTSSKNLEGLSTFDPDLIMKETNFVSPSPSNDPRKQSQLVCICRRIKDVASRFSSRSS